TYDSTNRTISSCPGATLNFQVGATSQSATNLIVLNAIQKPPASTFIVANQATNHPVGTFNWSPTTNDIGAHQLVIESKDSTCSTSQPLVLTSYVVYTIDVVKGMDAGPDIRNFCSLGGDPVQLNADGAPNINYRWSYVDGSAIPASEINNPFIKNPMVSPLVTTSYLVQTDSLPAVCKTRDTVIVFIDNLNGIEISPSEDPVVVC